MDDIFVSYTSADRDRVAPLVQAFQNRGWSVWWDRSIGAGENWDRVIEQKLETARCVVTVWTRNSAKSEWVRIEANLGRERGILAPVQLDDDPPPTTFRHIQTVNLAAWGGSADAPELGTLFAGVEKILGIERPHTPASVEQERALDAAIHKELTVSEPANLIAMVRASDSDGLRAILEAGDEYELDPGDVVSKAFTVSFPLDKAARLLSADLTLRLVSPHFDPPEQSRKIRVHPSRDSTLCSFLLTPLETGRLMVQLEVYQQDLTLVSRILRVNGVTIGQTVVAPAYQVATLPLTTVVEPIPTLVPTTLPRPQVHAQPLPTTRLPRPRELSLTDWKTLPVVLLLFGSTIGVWRITREQAPAPLEPPPIEGVAPPPASGPASTTKPETKSKQRPVQPPLSQSPQPAPITPPPPPAEAPPQRPTKGRELYYEPPPATTAKSAQQRAPVVTPAASALLSVLLDPGGRITPGAIVSLDTGEVKYSLQFSGGEREIILEIMRDATLLESAQFRWPEQARVQVENALVPGVYEITVRNTDRSLLAEPFRFTATRTREK